MESRDRNVRYSHIDRGQFSDISFEDFKAEVFEDLKRDKRERRFRAYYTTDGTKKVVNGKTISTIDMTSGGFVDLLMNLCIQDHGRDGQDVECTNLAVVDYYPGYEEGQKKSGRDFHSENNKKYYNAPIWYICISEEEGEILYISNSIDGMVREKTELGHGDLVTCSPGYHRFFQTRFGFRKMLARQVIRSKNCFIVTIRSV